MNINENEDKNRFYVQVFLSVIAVSSDPTKKDDSKFLVLYDENNNNMSFPNKFLTQEYTSRDIAEDLLNMYTGVTLDWAMLFPFGVVDDVNPKKEAIYILYGVFIPDITRLRQPNTRWISYRDLEDSDGNVLIKKLAYEVAWRHV